MAPPHSHSSFNQEKNMQLMPLSPSLLHVSLVAREEAEKLGVAHITFEIYLKVIFDAEGYLQAARFFKNQLRYGDFERRLGDLINSRPKSSKPKYVNCPAFEIVLEEAAYLQLRHAELDHYRSLSDLRVTVASFLWAASMTVAKDLFESVGLDLNCLTSREVLSYKQ